MPQNYSANDKPANPIKEWLNANPDITYTKFAQMVGVTFSTVSTWVNEHRTDLRASVLFKIIDATDIDPMELITWASYTQLVADDYFNKELKKHG